VVFGEGHDMETGENSIPASLNINNLEASVLHFPLLWQGVCLSRLADKHLRKNSWAASCLAYYVQFLKASHNPLSTPTRYPSLSISLYLFLPYAWLSMRNSWKRETQSLEAMSEKLGGWNYRFLWTTGWFRRLW
jgi:hypothetical protein